MTKPLNPNPLSGLGGFRQAGGINFNQAAQDLAGPQVQMPLRDGGRLPLNQPFPGFQTPLPGTQPLPVNQDFLARVPAPQPPPVIPQFPGFDLNQFLQGLNGPSIGGGAMIDPSVFMRLR